MGRSFHMRIINNRINKMMSTKAKATAKTSKGIKGSKVEVGKFFGKMVSFNTSLKLFHWHITGPGSYAQHIALDQALEALQEATDRLVETTYSMVGDINIAVPESKVPADIIKYASDFYAEVDESRALFTENYSAAVIDYYHEAIQQLLYRLKRLQ